MRRGLGIGLCLVSACAGTPQEPPRSSKAPVTVSAPKVDPCLAEAKDRAQQITALTGEGRLDDAWQLAQRADCKSAELDDALLGLLSDMHWGARLRIVAQRVAARAGVTPQTRARALKLGKMADEDALALGRRMVKQSEAATGVERRRALDAALLAFERASGEPPRPIALRSLRVAAVPNPSTAIVTAASEPTGRIVAVVVQLDGTPVRGRPRRLLGDGEYAPNVHANARGELVVDYREGGLAYASIGAPETKLPRALGYALLRSGRVLLADTEGISLRTGVTDAALVTSLKARLQQDTLRNARTLGEGRYWVACGPGTTLALDGDTDRVTIDVDHVISCDVDTARNQLVLIRAKAPTGPFVVHLLALDGSADTSLALTAQKSAENLEAHVMARTEGAAITSQGPARYVDLVRRRIVSSPPRPKPVGPPRLRAVSVGSMGDDRAAIAPLRALAQPPRRLVEPAFATIHSWTENGVLSFDGKTVAAYTENPRTHDVRLVIADASTLKVRHRIAVPYGINWLTAFFLNERLIVAQSYPSFMVYDVNSGDFIAALETQEAEVLFDRYLVAEASIWDLAPGLEQRKLDLGLPDSFRFSGKPPERVLSRKKDERGSLRFTKGGRVAIQDMDPPSYLYCAFGEQLAPWSVCEHRLSD